MAEIEIKIKVDNFEDLQKEFVKRNIELSEPVSQKDTVFINYEGEYTLFPENANYLRIREISKNKNGGVENSTQFTLKKSLNNKDELACIEKEIAISDAGVMKEIIELLDYHQAIQVNKVRRKASYNDYEFCLDVVEGLGTFIEIEKITDNDLEQTEKELLEVAKDFGLNIENRIRNGYDTLIYLQNTKNNI